MKCEVTKERILEAAKDCPEAKKTLEILFPEVFENEKPFCVVNDVLVLRGASQSLFQVVEIGNCSIGIKNITKDSIWANRAPRSYADGCGTANKFVTREEMVKILEGSCTPLEDIFIIRAIDFQNKLIKIK